MKFTVEAAPLVQEARWHSTQKVHSHADGSITAEFEVDGLDEIL